MESVIVSKLNWLGLVFGLGVFLLGMLVLEKSLAQAAQDGVRKWLFNYTKNPIAAIATGTCVTAFLQSSSLVTLILMAMVGANVLPLAHALGAVLGANLGTTFTGWLVTVLGFKLQLAAMALPLLGCGGLIVVFFESHRRLFALGGVLCGLGLLLLGLALMKSAVETLPEVLDFQILAGMPPIVFLLAGTALTAIIQSSSATMMITLTLLHAQLIQLPEAVAFIIGADLGTTSTSALGALKAQPTRRRLATAHILFNVVTDLTAFVVLLPLLPWFTSLWPTEDPLLQLVLFHSSFNVLGILLFLPFLGTFTRLLNRLFCSPEKIVTRFIHSVPITEQTMAILALSKEVLDLQNEVLRFCWRAVDGQQYVDRYHRLKIREGEIIQYGTQLIHATSTQLMSAARDSVYAAKSLTDVVEDWALEKESHVTHDIKRLLHAWRSRFRRQLAMIRQCYALLKDSDITELDAIDRNLKDTYRSQTQALHRFASDSTVSEADLSSLLNLNRELYNALQSLRNAVVEFIHAEQKAQNPLFQSPALKRTIHSKS